MKMKKKIVFQNIHPSSQPTSFCLIYFLPSLRSVCKLSFMASAVQFICSKKAKKVKNPNSSVGYSRKSGRRFWKRSWNGTRWKDVIAVEKWLSRVGFHIKFSLRRPPSQKSSQKVTQNDEKIFFLVSGHRNSTGKIKTASKRYNKLFTSQNLPSNRNSSINSIQKRFKMDLKIVGKQMPPLKKAFHRYVEFYSKVERIAQIFPAPPPPPSQQCNLSLPV